MTILDHRGTGVWPKHLPEFTDEQRQVRDAFTARWLEVLPGRYGVIERFNHSYAVDPRPGGRTLEIGAGLGEHLNFEDLAHQDYYVVELREELTKAIRMRYPEVTAIVGDCQERLPFAEKFFDRALAIHVLEHLPDLPRALDEIARVLAPGGRLFAVIPCEGGLAYGLARRISAKRVFEREFGMNYEWLIRTEHLNVPWEIFAEVRKRFRVLNARYFPFRIPSIAVNLVIGLTLQPLGPESVQSP